MESTNGQGEKHGRSKRSLALIAAALLLVLATGVLLAAEWAVRYRERHRTTIPSNTPSAFYEHHRTQPALVRNQDYYGWFLVNSHGLRGPEIPVSAPPGTTRIMVVGGSTTFDGQVSGEDRTWPARLEYWLRERTSNADIRVINAGTPGFLVLDNLIRLQMELFQFEPDVIVLYHGHNDVSCGIRRGRIPHGDRPHQIPVTTPWERWLQENSELYNKVLTRWQAIRGRWVGRRVIEEATRRPGPGQEPSPLACGPAQWKRDLTSFISVARSLGIDVVLAQVVHASGADAVTEADTAILRYWRGARPYVLPDSALRVYVRYRDILSAVADEQEVPFIPTGGFGIAGMEYYGRWDPMHFNDAGADRLGSRMADALLETGVLDDHVGDGAEGASVDR